MKDITMVYEGPDAEFVLSALCESVFMFGTATLTLFNTLTNRPTEEDDHEYVWTETMLEDAEIADKGDGVYILKLPKPAKK